ncbi:hypothetical protein BV22DRAFT_1128633 [Leucogyrophana mollusca]|uniref:Uncharacterized protein n=1 Tax=Leucogyrophana mollusca TaxID=85980 RepID=A0ACB8BKU8_9AGAM|nr:hypothetical protein BV22DRAFT_1128633 [Leucogyrophana mollusca]
MTSDSLNCYPKALWTSTFYAGVTEDTPSGIASTYIVQDYEEQFPYVATMPIYVPNEDAVALYYKEIAYQCPRPTHRFLIYYDEELHNKPGVDIVVEGVPHEDVLSGVISNIVNGNKVISSKALWLRLKALHPEWSVALKRVKCVRMKLDSAHLLPIVAIVIPPYDLDEFSDPLSLASYMIPVRRSRPQAQLEALQIVSSVLEETRIAHPLIFFSRHEQETDVYYQAYHSTYEPDDREPNSICSSLYKKNRHPSGSIVVVCNGASFAPSDTELDMDVEDLARTIWWYKRSGRNVSTVTAERRFSQFVKGLSMY